MRLAMAEYLAMARIPLGTYLAAQMFWAYARQAIQFGVNLLAGWAWFGFQPHPDARYDLAALALILGLLAVAGIGLISASMVWLANAWHGTEPVHWLVAVLAPLVAGAYFPPAILPHWLQVVSWCLPHTYALDALRHSLLGSAGAGGVAGEVERDLLVLALFAAVLLVLGVFRDPQAGRLDLVSAALSLAAVLAVIYGLKESAQDGFGSLPALSILAGLTVGALFVRRQLTLVDPMIDLRLFRISSFSASLATYMLGVFVVFGYFLFIPQYLQLVLGLSPLQAGLVTVPSMLAFIVGSQLAPRIVRRVRPAFLMGAGLALAALSLTVLAFVGGPPSIAVLVTVGVVTSLGTAPVFTLTNELIVGSAPPERAGAASGIAETGAELGGALGIAVLGSVGTAVYRRALADRLPTDFPSEAAEIARDTLGVAVGVAGQLPDQLGRALLEVAGAAFVQGLHLAAGISAAVALAAALAAVILLRHVPASAAPEGSADSQVVPPDIVGETDRRGLRSEPRVGYAAIEQGAESRR
ncbi:MAG: MFS transporter [Chloroflexi bacterium]|nr:MFS transporter [Chloroflexota bacterium]